MGTNIGDDVIDIDTLIIHTTGLWPLAPASTQRNNSASGKRSEHALHVLQCQHSTQHSPFTHPPPTQQPAVFCMHIPSYPHTFKQ